MKTDWKLFVAVLVLIGLVVWLLLITINRTDSVERAIQEIRQSKPAMPQVINGKTPILGVDYFNGLDGAQGPKGQDGVGTPGKDGAAGLSAFDIAQKNGFQGTEQEWLQSLKGEKGDKGERGDVIQVECMAGILAKKLSTDDFWNLTNIKCEVMP